MAQQQIRMIGKYIGSKTPCITNIRCISTSSVKELNQKWREQKGLPLNPNACGVLTDAPDYSYLDGRPTPYGIRQLKRLHKQKEIADTVRKLSGEIDFAIERHKQIQIAEEKQKRKIIESKLKPKGLLLLKKKTS